MHQNLGYPVTLDVDDDGDVVVSFRDFEGAHTDGRTQAEALAEAQDCLREVVARSLRHRQPVPAPSLPQPGDVVVPMPVFMVCKLMLREAFEQGGWSYREAAATLDTDAKEVQRLLDPDHASRVDRMTEALVRLQGLWLEVAPRAIPRDMPAPDHAVAE